MFRKKLKIQNWGTDLEPRLKIQMKPQLSD